jgi:hypothetical protein
MQDDVDARLKRIERKVDWAAEVAWLAAMAAVVLVLREILSEAGVGHPIIAAIAGMVVAGYIGLRAYRRLGAK